MTETELCTLADQAESALSERFLAIDRRARALTERVLCAFQAERVDSACFDSVSGYGYDDRGREALDRVYARVFECEKALVRHHFVSGTHALAVALFALLRPGDTLLCATGRPYDTLDEVLGDKSENPSSLKAFGIHTRFVDLALDGAIDEQKLFASLNGAKVVYFQRSRGYEDRPTIPVKTLADLFSRIRAAKPEVFIVVDNCYGEFCADHEPSFYGADLCAGSLIKNPGGGMCETGGYLAGSSRAVELCADRLTSPGLGGHVGATLYQNKAMFKGLFYAPHTVAQALKAALFCAKLFETLGYAVSPASDEIREDLIQSVRLRDPDKLIAFCQGIQSKSPVDAYAAPVPAPMPGYADEVIMAAGTFTQGASIELSADAPMREPYTVYLQGALTYESARCAILEAARRTLACRRP